MNKVYESIMKNDVWDVVPRPQDKSVVTSKWLYKIKHGADGSAEKFKARFVARGFSHICTHCSLHHHSFDYSPCCFTRMESTLDGCQDCLLALFT